VSLLRMPFAEMKIDRSFIGVCRTDPDAWKLVRTTVALARELGMNVVAEGIETEAVSERLRDVGCDVGQGWYFGRPMQSDALLRWLAPAGTAVEQLRELATTSKGNKSAKLASVTPRQSKSRSLSRVV
jgi:EAL domain-containing protein (putative c-di-GMP-specific phosphodiesterase class I)